MSPQVSGLVHAGIVEAQAYDQVDTFEAGVQFGRLEGILPAPESNHAVKAAIAEALKCKETGEPRVILFNLSGHGNFDMLAYSQYVNGELPRYEYPEEEIATAMTQLPSVEFPG